MPLKVVKMCGESPCDACAKKECKQNEALTIPVNKVPPDPTVSVDDYEMLQTKQVACFGATPPMAAFIHIRDKIPAWYAFKMYEKMPTGENYGYSLHAKSDHVGVWTNDSLHAIVAFRGTVVDNWQDIGDDLQIAIGDSCNLEILSEALPFLNDLYTEGYQITLCGHSLGGKAAICLSVHPGVVNTVVLNAGAPITNPDYMSGNHMGTHYHILGDLISTHVYNMRNVIIKYKDNTDWLDPWNHGSARFLGGMSYQEVSPQYEQEDLEDFIYKRGAPQLFGLTILPSFLGLGFWGKLKELICKVPIPGAESSILCNAYETKGGNEALRMFFGIVGALLGIIKGPKGAIAGYEIGRGIADGDLSGVLGLIVPGYNEVLSIVKASVNKVIEDSRGKTDLEKKLQEIIKGE